VSSSDDDRIAYLAGEDVPSLSPDDRAALDALRADLRSPVTWEEPDPALEDRVVMAIASEAGTAQRSGPHARTSAAGAERATPREHSLRGFAQRLWGRRPVLALSALAAAAIAVVVLITAVGNTASEEQFAMVVLGTSLAPQAHGSATLTKMPSGWRIQLDANGLPRREGAEFYEAWLKNNAGILVPVGTFNDARQVTLWSGVPVTKFRTLSVTEQVANGNPASSGRRVLIGTIRN
jgi:Anti-sigma-K factor rskA